MGTVQTIAGSVKSYGRVMAAACYAAMPGFLSALKGKVSILTYHRVLSQNELSTQYVQPGMYVSVDVFDRQLQFLKRHCTVLSFADLLAMWSTKQWDVTQRYCVVTFDDGWLDNYRHAFPLLKRYEIPATIFLPTDYIGTDRWFWPDKVGWLHRQFVQRSMKKRELILSKLQGSHAWSYVGKRTLLRHSPDATVEWCKTLSPAQIVEFVSSWAEALEVIFPSNRQVVNWEEVRSMSDAGVSFGSHSVTHAILTKLHADDVLREAVDSWSVLAQQSIRVVPVFCYPNGDWSEGVKECIQAAGYHAATTTQFGYESATPTNQFGLKRINVHHDVTCTDSLFAFHLAGFNHRDGG